MAKKGVKVNTRATDDVDIHIGAFVRMRRRELGMSQERLAELLGVTFQQVQKYENGKNRIAARTLWRIASILELDVVAFFPDGAERAVSSSVLTSPDFAVLAAVYEKLNARGRRAVIATAQSFSTDPEMSAGAKSRKK